MWTERIEMGKRINLDSSRIQKMYLSGMTMKSISNTVGCSIAAINRVLRELNVEKRPRGVKYSNSERDTKIIKLIEEGELTYAEIGKMFGISRQRTCEIYRRRGSRGAREA